MVCNTYLIWINVKNPNKVDFKRFTFRFASLKEIIEKKKYPKPS